MSEVGRRPILLSNDSVDVRPVSDFHPCLVGQQFQVRLSSHCAIEEEGSYDPTGGNSNPTHYARTVQILLNHLVWIFACPINAIVPVDAAIQFELGFIAP